MITLELTTEEAKMLKDIFESNIDANDLSSEELDVMGDVYDQISRKTCDDILVSNDCESKL